MTSERRGRGETSEGREAEAAVAKEQEQGYVGIKVDPIDDEAYTVAGVTGGKAPRPTQAEMREAGDAAGRKLDGDAGETASR